jgi:hypothetical protein
MSRKPTLLTVALVLAAGPSLASFHEMRIVEVGPGTVSAPLAQYVVLQMCSANQNFVATHSVFFFNAAGTQIDMATFGGMVAHGEDQRLILVATPEAVQVFGVAADLTMPAKVLAAGGKVCWDVTNLDCVSWGSYAGSSTGTGTPFAALQLGKAIHRKLSIAGSPTHLDCTGGVFDDTDNSASDFFSGPFAAGNNGGTTTHYVFADGLESGNFSGWTAKAP